MRRACSLLLIAACGGDNSSGPPLTVSTSFVVTEMSGNGPAPIDAPYQKTIDFEVVFPTVDSAFGDAADPRGCLSTIFATLPATRTARGDTASVVQPEILDLLAA